MTHQVFDKSDILDSYKLDEFLASYNVGAPICDFMPNVRLNDLDLQKWKDSFTKDGIPWVVTLHRDGQGKCILWKLDERLTPVEIDAERMKPDVNWFQEGSR